MTERRLAAVDAQTHWMSRIVPNDQFLVYGCAGAPADLGAAVAAVEARARNSAELTVRVADRGFRRWPVWEHCDIEPGQFVVHDDSDTWARCLAHVSELGAVALEAGNWRVHVFPRVADMPVCGTGSVVVIQISHALGDGVRSSALAARLLGRDGEIPSATPGSRWPAAGLPWRGTAAARAHRRLHRDAAAGLVPPPAPPRPALRTNTGSGRPELRTLVRRRDQLPGPTVTVGALGAVAGALDAHLRALGDDPADLAAEVPMARTTVRQSNNHYGNVGVGLYPGYAAEERTRRIAADLAARRRRAAHPATAAESAAFAAVPASLLRWGVGHFDPAARSDVVTGHTVVSSVNRGPADLDFGGVPVVFTTGFPALSPMMGLAHGLHGLGDVVVLSVHADESALGGPGGIDAYVERLERALS